MIRASDRAQQGLPADQAEGHDREDHDDHQELGAAARVGRRVRPDRLGREWVAGLEGVDRHVLGAVVLEDAPDVRRATDDEQVADEDQRPG